MPFKLCDRFRRNPSDLSNAGLVTAFQALTLLCGDASGRLLMNLEAECQHRLERGSLDVHQSLHSGETLIKLHGPGCLTLDLIIYQLQGESLEAFTPEDIVTLYRLLQASPESGPTASS